MVARLRYPDDRVAYVYDEPGRPILMPDRTPLPVFTDQACTQPADIQYPDGTQVPSGILRVGPDGLVPEFLGPPDGASTLYTRAAAGQPVYALYAEATARIDQLATAVGQPDWYTHNQTNPAATWPITHNLGHAPAGVKVFDTAGTSVVGATIRYIDDDTCELQFGFALAGKAYLS
jgi:hypothetical protein